MTVIQRALVPAVGLLFLTIHTVSLVSAFTVPLAPVRFVQCGLGLGQGRWPSSLVPHLFSRHRGARKAWRASANPTFESFDWNEHWYPVTWAVDLPINRPTQVTLFDVDYVLTRRAVANCAENATLDDEFEVFAMRDACPHKAASLSEGRITSTGDFQCAYHGWTFDGKTGKCTQIPQRLEGFVDGELKGGAGSSSAEGGLRREDGVAVPAMLSQGMVWLFPSGGLERALLAAPPPRVPEMDLPGFKASPAVRDFPVDWPVLIENILDPDHGLFAHQNQNFDLYSASPRAQPQSVTEETPTVLHAPGREGSGWRITSEVDSVHKLVDMDKARRKARQEEAAGMKEQIGQAVMRRFRGGDVAKEQVASAADAGASDDAAPLIATSYYVAPSLIVSCRRDPAKNNATGFLTAFWVSPTGTGRSRFMSAAVGPFAAPRWLLHMNLNNFLDQDTYLLATQCRHTLAAEAAALEAAPAAEHADAPAVESREVAQRAAPVGAAESRGATATAPTAPHRTQAPSIDVHVRRGMYVYRSPSERLAVRLGAFFDATLARVPNRPSALRAMGGSAGILNRPVSPRSDVLDRYNQHTRICPDSQGAVRTCRTLKTIAQALAVTLITVKALSGAQAPALLAAVGAALSPLVLGLSLAVLGVVGWAARAVQREFEFKYTPEFRNRDVDKIPAVWMD